MRAGTMRSLPPPAADGALDRRPWRAASFHPVPASPPVAPRPYLAATALAMLMVLSLQGLSFTVGHRADPARMLRLPDPSRPAGASGFDGQFFLALTKDPLALAPATAKALDAPVLRARRIGLPLTAWLLSRFVGGAAAGLLLAETLFLFVLVAIVQGELRREGLPPLLCPAVALLLPFALSMELVTAELPTAVLLLLSARQYRRGRHWSALAALAAACLFKEAAVLAVASLAVSSALRRRRRESVLRLACMLPLAGWQAYLWLRFARNTGIGGLLPNLELPGRGLLAAIVNPLAELAVGGFQAKELALLTATLWYVAGAVFAVLLLKRGPSDGRLIAGVGAALVFLLYYGGSAQAYNEIFNFGRQLFLVVVGISNVLLHEPGSLSRNEHAFITAWLLSGAALGMAWWAHEIVSSGLAA
jgi:hypothetical protein